MPPPPPFQPAMLKNVYSFTHLFIFYVPYTGIHAIDLEIVI